MLEAKIIIGVIAIVLTFIGYIPYIRDIFKKKTTPHIFTWFIWTLAVGITYGLQVAGTIHAWQLFPNSLSLAIYCQQKFCFRPIQHAAIVTFLCFCNFITKRQQRYNKKRCGVFYSCHSCALFVESHKTTGLVNYTHSIGGYFGFCPHNTKILE